MGKNVITSKTLPFHIDGKYHMKRSDLLAEIQALIAPIGTSQTLAAAGLFIAAKKTTSKSRKATRKPSAKKSAKKSTKKSTTVRRKRKTTKKSTKK